MRLVSLTAPSSRISYVTASGARSHEPNTASKIPRRPDDCLKKPAMWGSVIRTVVAVAISLGLALVLFLRTASAQERGGMMWGRMHMMGWPMMLVMGLFWILLLILMVLAILWLIKQLRK